ncbi:MAG: hypothetical protein AAF555_03010 [Verrucomicrobiota bacterium]
MKFWFLLLSLPLLLLSCSSEEEVYLNADGVPLAVADLVEQIRQAERAQVSAKEQLKRMEVRSKILDQAIVELEDQIAEIAGAELEVKSLRAELESYQTRFPLPE